MTEIVTRFGEVTRSGLPYYNVGGGLYGDYSTVSLVLSKERKLKRAFFVRDYISEDNSPFTVCRKQAAVLVEKGDYLVFWYSHKNTICREGFETLDFNPEFLRIVEIEGNKFICERVVLDFDDIPLKALEGALKQNNTDGRYFVDI